jgi:hypothetical protein
MSWEFGESSYGVAYRRGSTVCDDGTGSRLCKQRHLGLPRFRALHAGGKTPTSYLLCIISTEVTMLLELFGLEEEEEDRISLV